VFFITRGYRVGVLGIRGTRTLPEAGRFCECLQLLFSFLFLLNSVRAGVRRLNPPLFIRWFFFQTNPAASNSLRIWASLILWSGLIGTWGSSARYSKRTIRPPRPSSGNAASRPDAKTRDTHRPSRPDQLTPPAVTPRRWRRSGIAHSRGRIPSRGLRGRQSSRAGYRPPPRAPSELVTTLQNKRNNYIGDHESSMHSHYSLSCRRGRT
jgi:hypothetical protein